MLSLLDAVFIVAYKNDYSKSLAQSRKQKCLYLFAITYGPYSAKTWVLLNRTKISINSNIYLAYLLNRTKNIYWMFWWVSPGVK